jgi:DNA-directed RNA polymerase specialized sigma24 family protein
VADDFEEFVRNAEPSLRRALTGLLPLDLVPDGLAEAFAYAWEHWDRMRELENTTGYLVRVAQTHTRTRLAGYTAPRVPEDSPRVEPALVPALRALSTQQRAAVWLVHGCGWSYAEAGLALAISVSAVGTHVSRGMAHLRLALGVDADA